MMSSGVSQSHLVDEEARRRFELAWRKGAPEPIECFLPPETAATYRATLEELIHIEMELAHKAAAQGNLRLPAPTRVEAYLARFPILQDDATVERLLEQEFRVRRRHGERPSASEYRRRFPQITDRGSGTPSWLEEGHASGGSDGPFTPGQQLGRYRLRQQHARGGFGLIWRAEDDSLGREVALKQLSARLAANPAHRDRFVAEARIAAQLEHPGIVPVYDLGEAEGDHPYYTMKLVAGVTLGEAIRRYHEEERSESDRAVERVRLLNAYLGVARAMAFAHARGVIHRDLKPDNIILGGYGETVILDWGLAKVLTRELASPLPPDTEGEETRPDETVRGTVLGTPAYMSPEQAAGRTHEIDHRSDVYALGTILYELLTGRRPFQGDSSDQVLKRVVDSDPEPPRQHQPRIPRALEAICLKAMAKRPADRYQEVFLLVRDLERFLADEPVQVHQEAIWQHVLRWARRHRAWAAALCVAIVLLGLGAVAGLFLWQQYIFAEQQQRQERLDEARRGAEADEKLGYAELHAGQFASAERLFHRGVELCGDQEKLAELRARLLALASRTHDLVEYYRLADEAERLEFLEYDDEAEAACENALRHLGVMQHDDWWRRLPAQDLLEPQRVQLREDAYRTLLLLGAIRAKRSLLAQKPEDVRKSCEATLALTDKIAGFRLSQSARLVEIYCYSRLGKIQKLPPRQIPEPSCAADCYFMGIIHFWIPMVADDPITRYAFSLGNLVPGLDLKDPKRTSDRLLRTACALEPRHYWNHFWMAWSLLGNGQPEAAELSFDACIALRPRYGLGYAMRAQALLAQLLNLPAGPAHHQIKTRCLSDLAEALRYGPNDVEIHFRRGRVFEALGMTTEAVDAYTRYLEVDRPLVLLSERRILNEVKQARNLIVAYANKLLEPAADREDALVLLAMAQLSLEQEALAAKTAERVLRQWPGQPRALVVRGVVRLGERNPEAARADFEKALELEPGNYQAAVGLAQALEHLDQTGDALNSYDRALKAATAYWQTVQSQLGRARMLVRQGRTPDALRALEAARQINPPAADALEAQLFPGGAERAVKAP